MNAPTHATPKASTTNFHQAARLSWIVPLCGAMGGGFLRRFVGGFAADLITIVFVVSGLVLAVVALTAVPKLGRKGLLAPAIVGLLLSLGLIAIFVSNFLAAVARSPSIEKG